MIRVTLEVACRPGFVAVVSPTLAIMNAIILLRLCAGRDGTEVQAT